MRVTADLGGDRLETGHRQRGFTGCPHPDLTGCPQRGSTGCPQRLQHVRRTRVQDDAATAAARPRTSAHARTSPSAPHLHRQPTTTLPRRRLGSEWRGQVRFPTGMDFCGKSPSVRQRQSRITTSS
ncbi:hypothetical protein C0Q70_11197 [Pomacea canaliculata]|uniref:Uncharacterized protein n=1 Tax=Pomacea canaliculata TaxID=400727 RepID=A0A2T7P5A4_POMCA|nr:hypothetical protein C0Q70_11197 [Pomacea canaliculata]